MSLSPRGGWVCPSRAEMGQRGRQRTGVRAGSSAGVESFYLWKGHTLPLRRERMVSFTHIRRSFSRGCSKLANQKMVFFLLLSPYRIIMDTSLKWGVYCVNTLFAETLRKLRMKKGLSQIQLGKQLFVNHSTIARWESGSRLPDTATIPRLAECLGVDANTLFQLAAQSDESPNVILVDDSKVILTEGLAVLEEVLPDAEIKGFIWPQEAIDYARANRVALAVLDIELGNSSGLALCRTLLEINPRTNVLFLTAYPDYSLDAWGTEACGFMLKPITAEGVRRQLQKLRYPFLTGGVEA